MNIPELPFYFIRHGETDWNRANWIMGHTDIPLNEAGKNQCLEAKGSIKTLNINKIWSSPLTRARQTAEILNELFSLPLTFHDKLKERGWGVDEGKSHAKFHPDMEPALIKEIEEKDYLPVGAESYKEFESRIIMAFQEILVPASLPPLIVSHGGVLRVLSNLLGNSCLTAENCGLYYFNPLEPNNLSATIWSIEKLNNK